MNSLPPTNSRLSTSQMPMTSRNDLHLTMGSYRTGSPTMGSIIMGSLILERNTFPMSVTLTENPLIQNHLLHYYHHPMTHDFWPDNFSPLMTRKPLSVRLSYCHHKLTATKIVLKSSSSFNSMKTMSSRTPNMSSSVLKSTIPTSTRI